MKIKTLPGDKKAVVLLSGGLDSATTLFLARKRGFRCFCLVFDYGQRHQREIGSAKKIARFAHCAYRLIKLRFPWKGSALLDRKSKIPAATGYRLQARSVIPNTYVPARNTVFLSLALAYAEAINAGAIFIGANAVDFSGYPDCRPEFYRAFKKVAACATKSGVEGKKIRIETPLIEKSKAEIIRLGASLGVPFQWTWSCYAGKNKPCAQCDSCYLRAKGFRQAKIKDPLLGISK